MRTLAIILLLASSVCAETTVIRPNVLPGIPDPFSRGTVITDRADGSARIAPEVYPGSGSSSPLDQGYIATPQADGSMRIQREALPGMADPFDSGYTVRSW